jgi:exopolysaccharide production protein ExoZ
MAAGRLLSLQVMRGLAANLVIFSHLLTIQTKYTGAFLPGFALYGIAGVDLFFVLSGFIMVAVAGTGIGARQFLWRRAVRIYPVYWVVSAVVLATSLIEPAWVNSSFQAPTSLWRSFLLVPDSGLPLLAVGWTLVHEVYFYLVFAVFLSLRIGIRAGLVGWAVALIVLKILANDTLAGSPLWHVWTSPLTAEFILGAATGVLYQRKSMRGGTYAGAVGIALLAMSIVFLAPALSLVENPHLDSLRVILFGVPAALIVYWLVAREQGLAPVPRGLFVALGDWSYATYLTHILVLSAIGRLIHAFAPPGLTSALLLTVVGVVGANVAGAWICKYFERPSLRTLHRLGATRLRKTDQTQADGLSALVPSPATPAPGNPQDASTAY